MEPHFAEEIETITDHEDLDLGPKLYEKRFL